MWDFEGGRQVSDDEQQTQTTDDPSGAGWRDVEVGDSVCEGDMWSNYPPEWHTTESIGQHRRRIEPEQPSDSEPGWRDVTTGSVTQDGDMVRVDGQWCEARPGETVFDGDIVRRRIQQPQPSDSESETMEQLRRRLAECEVLLAEADRGGQQVNAELQQLRKQVQTLHNLAEMSRRQVADEAGKVEQLKEQMQTLTQERDRYRNQLAGAIEHSGAPEAQAQLVDRLQKWLRPVLELVAEHPEDASPLAVAVLGFLPGIASRLIEE
jgi:Spy/CpxP family protein refolding chaperone